MSRTRVKLAGPVAAAALIAAGASWYFRKEPEFRRDPLVEAAGAVLIIPTYQASYTDCADARYERNADVRGIALALAGEWAHRFPAWDDADAVAFARAALPECRLDMLVRKRRFGFTRAQRRERIPVDIGAY